VPIGEEGNEQPVDEPLLADDLSMKLAANSVEDLANRVVWLRCFHASLRTGR
jgi:hypothetical protein